MVVLAVLALSSIGYLFFTFSRLDWVRYVTEPYYWRVQALVCPQKKPQAVIVLSDNPNSSPKHILNHDPELSGFLKSLPAQPVQVEIKRRGYLWEWNYGVFLVLSIENHEVQDYLHKPPEEVEDCVFKPADTLDPNLLLIPYTQTS